jgi:hypothetical protein
LGTNGFTGPILASITALTRLVFLYASPPPVRSAGRLGRANQHIVAQGRQQEPLLWQRAPDDLRADRAHAHVRPKHSRAPTDAGLALLRERVAARAQLVRCGRVLHRA